MPTPNEIKRQIRLEAPIDRVWSAISDSRQFGVWSGMSFDGPFVAHAKCRARRAATAGSDHRSTEWHVGTIDPKRLFSVLRHPFPIDSTRDYSKEKRNLVTFNLSSAGQETMLSIAELGYDDIPEDRRDHAYRDSSEGWDIQLANLAKYVARVDA